GAAYERGMDAASASPPRPSSVRACVIGARRGDGARAPLLANAGANVHPVCPAREAAQVDAGLARAGALDPSRGPANAVSVDRHPYAQHARTRPRVQVYDQVALATAALGCGGLEAHR